MVRLKALALVTRLPVPPWRGDQVRAYHHLRLLAARHEITLCALVMGEVEPAHAEAVRALGLRLEVVRLGRLGAAPSLARAPWDARPLQVLLYRRAGALAAVRALYARERWDVVHAQLVRTGAYWPAPDGPPVVLDLIDALSENFARRAARDRGPIAWASAIEGPRLARYEHALAERAAATLVVAEPDARLLAPARVTVVPNGVDTMAFARASAGAAVPGRVVFAGNLGYFPNVDAARWLVEEILPVLRSTVPNAHVHLAGARPSPAVRALAARPGVTLRADVPSLAPEIASGAVTVIPMRSGSGLQNKVLEAMAVGTPVVTTPQVASALAAHDGEHLLVGADAAGLAAAAGTLLRDAPRARSLADAAHALVMRHYSWEASAGAVERAWMAACGRAR